MGNWSTNIYFCASAWVKNGGPWEPMAVRCYISECMSFLCQVLEPRLCSTSASGAAAWANPEDIRRGRWREVFTQNAARTPPQTSWQRTPHKRLSGHWFKQFKAFEKHYQYTLAIFWEERGNAVRPLSGWRQNSLWLQPQYSQFLRSHRSHCAHLSSGRSLLAQERGEKLLGVITERLPKRAPGHVIWGIQGSSGILFVEKQILVWGWDMRFCIFNKLPGDTDAAGL